MHQFSMVILTRAPLIERLSTTSALTSDIVDILPIKFSCEKCFLLDLEMLFLETEINAIIF